jgi:hypothetical protein
VRIRMKNNPNIVRTVLIIAGLIFLLLLAALGFFNFFFFSLQWWITLEILLIVGFFYCYKIFAFLPDRGYGVARFFCLLMIAYFTWLGGSIKILPYSQVSLSIILFILVGVAGYFYGTKKKLREETLAYFNEHKTYLIAGEIIFFFVP